MALQKSSLGRPRIKDLHSHLVCGICMGYFVDATTINECLHSFCRSCIVKYLDTSNFCPMCDVQIHKSRPLQNLRPDKMLQELVYKVVPGVYASEMQRRRDYYTTAKEKGLLTADAENQIILETTGTPGGSQHYSPDESILLSLEYYIENDYENGGDKVNEEEEEISESNKDEKENPSRRFYKCPAAVCIRILKKLLRSKYGLHENEKVDIIYERECLPEHFTLIDVGYIFSCKAKGLLKFYFRFYTKPHVANATGTKTVKRSLTETPNSEVKRPRVNTVESNSPRDGESLKNDRKTSLPLTTFSHDAFSQEDPEKCNSGVVKEKSPTLCVPPPKRTPEKKDEKVKRPLVEKEAPIPVKKTKVDPPKVEAPTVTPPKPITQPPKPIQPGLKPPSQTSLLLKQQIAQQREQQKQQQLLKMRQMMNQKQVKMGVAKSDASRPPAVLPKQLPHLQKLGQKSPVKPTSRPVMPQPATVSIGTQSLPIISKTPEASPKQQLPTLKNPLQTTKSPQMHPQKPSVSVSHSTTTSVNKSTSPSPIPQPQVSTDNRRITNDMIEKNKLRPVVVIERHGNGRPKVKQVPSPLKLHQQMSREFNKISADALNTPKTTLSVAPTDSATKLKIVKTPTTSPENADNSKKQQEVSQPQSNVETPKGKRSDGDILDLSGKSTRKSDSPVDNTSLLSPSAPNVPSPPAPKLPSPTAVPIDQRKSPPVASKPTPQQQKPMIATNKPKQVPNNKANDIMKIAQTSLNEKLNFFRQFQANQSTSSPTPQQSHQAKFNSYSYQSLMNDAIMRTNLAQQQQKLQRAISQHQQSKARLQNTQAPRPSIGPRPSLVVTKPPSAPQAPIRIPNPQKTSPPRSLDNSPLLLQQSRSQPRIHDLFPNPQQSKPGPNQAVRHIPNPSLLGRQNAMRLQQLDVSPANVRKDEITITPARNPAAASPSHSASHPNVSTLRKIESLTQNLPRSLCDGKLTAPPSMSIGVVSTDTSQ